MANRMAANEFFLLFFGLENRKLLPDLFTKFSANFWNSRKKSFNRFATMYGVFNNFLAAHIAVSEKEGW